MDWESKHLQLFSEFVNIESILYLHIYIGLIISLHTFLVISIARYTEETIALCDLEYYLM